MAAENEAVIVLSIDRSQLNQQLNQSKGKFRGFASSVKKDFGGVGRSIRTALAFGGIGAGIGGILAAGKQVFNFEKKLVRLQINARKTAPEMAAFRKELFDIATATGADPDELLGAAAKYAEKTGDLDTFRRGMEKIAKVALGTGTALDETAGLVAELGIQFDIKKAKDIERMFDILQTGATLGAIELKDLAADVSSVAPLFATFGRKGVRGMQELAAVMQVAKLGFRDSAETATGLKDAMIQISKAKEKLEGKGIDVTKLGLAGTLKEVNKRIGGSAAKLKKLFGGRASSGLLRVVLQFGEKGGKAFDELNKKGLGAGRAMKDFGTFSESAGAKVDRAKARMKQAFNKALVNNIDAIASGIESIGKAFSFMAENPKITAFIASLILLSKVAGGLSAIKALVTGAGAAAAGNVAAGTAAGAATTTGAATAGAGASLASRVLPFAAVAALTQMSGDQADMGKKLKEAIIRNQRKGFAEGMRDASLGVESRSPKGLFTSGGEGVLGSTAGVQGYDAGFKLGLKTGGKERAANILAAADTPFGIADTTAERESKAVAARSLVREQEKQQLEILIRLDEDGRLAALFKETQNIRRRK